MLRNALAASSLREDEDDNMMELHALSNLADVLFLTHGIDEVEPLVPRFREAAAAQSLRDRARFCSWELESLYASARILEVGNPSPPRLPSFHHGR